MNKIEALEALEGHNILSKQSAIEICQVLEVTLPESLILHWNTAHEAYTRYGIFTADKPNEGVDSLELSYSIAEQLGIEAPGHKYSGVGFQTKANRQAIAQYLSATGRL